AAPQAVYQSERWAPVKYDFANLVPGKLYKTRLHFAEIAPSVTQAGDRLFNVYINGGQVLANFDIFASAGAKFRAVTRQFNTSADGLGNIQVHLARGSANEPKISGLEIFPYTNTAPVLASIPTKIVNAGAMLTFTNSATDADLPADALTYGVTNSPAGASVSSVSGVFTWTAPQVTSTQTNAATVLVIDNGTPPLSNSKTFSIVVVAPPKLSSVLVTNGDVNLTWATYPGKNYKVQFKADLNAPLWTDLGGSSTAGGSTLSVTDIAPADTQRFYRIVQLD
ncbi:MAG: glycoside hydrolase family 16, partial [Verrucomicrobiales bacterium]|nr:glycoside hydrolase family 16 [Verrucomicrobiales bacterium]